MRNHRKTGTLLEFMIAQGDISSGKSPRRYHGSGDTSFFHNIRIVCYSYNDKHFQGVTIRKLKLNKQDQPSDKHSPSPYVASCCFYAY